MDSAEVENKSSKKTSSTTKTTIAEVTEWAELGFLWSWVGLIRLILLELVGALNHPTGSQGVPLDFFARFFQVTQQGSHRKFIEVAWRNNQLSYDYITA